MISSYSIKLWNIFNRVKPVHFLYELNAPKQALKKVHLFLILPYGIFGMICFLFNPLSLVFLVNTLLGIVLAIETLTRINLAQGYIDLLGLTPLGRAAMYWLWIKQIAHTHFILRPLQELTRFFQSMGLMLLLSVILLFVNGGHIQEFEDNALAYRPVDPLQMMDEAILGGVVVLDYYYSFLFGALIGILIPNYTAHRILAPLFALMILGILQLAAYLPLFIRTMDVVSSTLLTLTIYITVREIGIMVLWKLIEQHLNTDIEELAY